MAAQEVPAEQPDDLSAPGAEDSEDGDDEGRIVLEALEIDLTDIVAGIKPVTSVPAPVAPLPTAPAPMGALSPAPEAPPAQPEPPTPAMPPEPPPDLEVPLAARFDAVRVRTAGIAH